MNVFPALEYLALVKVSISSIHLLQQFFVAHKQMRALIIRRCYGITSEVVRSIGTYLENITELHFVRNFIQGSESIEQILNNILHLGELKNLQVFAWYSRISIENLLAKMIANKIALKHFYFGDGMVDDKTIEAIKEMRNLENLQFCQTKHLKNEHLIEIVQELTKLKKLNIAWQQNITFSVLKVVLRHTKQLTVLQIRSRKYPLDPTLYNGILDIVQERRNGIKLTINIDSTDVQALIPQQTIDMNRNWLMIEHGPIF